MAALLPVPLRTLRAQGLCFQDAVTGSADEGIEPPQTATGKCFRNIRLSRRLYAEGRRATADPPAYGRARGSLPYGCRGEHLRQLLRRRQIHDDTAPPPGGGETGIRIAAGRAPGERLHLHHRQRGPAEL